MAASLSRPDPTSPASVAEAGFTGARRGYNQDEVRAFLTSVAAEMSRLHERQRQLEAELRAARAGGPQPTELDEELATKLLGEETLRVLHTARESAHQIKVRAEETAARTLRESHDEANRIRQDAEVDGARRRQDAQSEAEAELALAKQQGREMVTEARAYRERVLADLERRTKLARQHIDELAGGRERLLQVFERARLVAVDVSSELQSFAGPEEFVSFAPTTGPVPLMVPASELDAVSRVTEIDDAHDAHDERPELVDEPAVAETADTDDTDDTDDDIDDIAPASEPAEIVTEAPAIEAQDDVAHEPKATEPEPSPGDDAKPRRGGKVVALFPGREASASDDSAPAAGASDVDSLFARLRDEVTTAPQQPALADADDSEATAFTRRDEALVPLIVTAARKAKRVLADEQNGVLDRLRQKLPVTSLDAVAADVAVHVATYVDAIADELASASASGASELGAKPTATLRRTLDKAGALDGARMFVRTNLVEPLRERVERSITDGAGDNDDITKRVRAVYREWKTQHIDDQLDDIFRYAYGGGITVTVEPGAALVWTLDPSAPACADCEDNSLAGSVAAGEPFPTGHTSAPAHPGCRCLALPAAR